VETITRAGEDVRDTTLPGPANIAGTVYGTIVVMAAIAAGVALDLGPWQLVGSVAGGVLVIWLAHVYAHALGESLERGQRLDLTEVRSIGRRELAIPLAATAPTAALVLGGAGLLGEGTGAWLGMAIGLVILFVEGLRYARLEHLGRMAGVVTVGLNLAIGLAIVLLKALVQH
jgi:hypothetical protein